VAYYFKEQPLRIVRLALFLPRDLGVTWYAEIHLYGQAVLFLALMDSAILNSH